MRNRRIIFPAVVLMAALGIHFATRKQEAPPSQAPPSQAPSPPSSPAPQAAVPVPETVPPVETPPLPAGEHATTPAPAIPKPPSPESRPTDRRDLENPLVPTDPPSTPPSRRAADAEPDVAAAFDKISLMFRAYRDIADGNPVGSNAEIMKAIMGENPKGAKIGPPEGQTVNDNGELLDPWGTPYFFHSLTKDLMEIRSAGPDQKMWTGDDLTGN